MASFEEDFPSLKDTAICKVTSCEEEGGYHIFIFKGAIENCCLDKSKVREAIEKYRRKANEGWFESGKTQHKLCLSYDPPEHIKKAMIIDDNAFDELLKELGI